MNMLKKIKLALLASGVMLSSFGAYAVKEELEKKSVQSARPSSETQKIVTSGTKVLGKEKANLLRQHKFPIVRWENLPVMQEALKEVIEKSST